jgi:hypothetical protein
VTGPAGPPPAGTIGDVLARLDGIVEQCLRDGSRLGYFAALYRSVTRRVREGIAAGRFEDGPRMERLDVIFANRYLDAVGRLWSGEEPTRSWQLAFRAAERRPPTILQHLLLGMNAHINLDLAVAAAEAAPGDALPGLKRDFDEVTVLLDEMIRGVEARLERVSPWLGLIDAVGGRTDEAIGAFAIGKARSLAWCAARLLSPLGPEARAREISCHDDVVVAVGRGIQSPGPLLRAALLVARARETHPVADVIEALAA